MTEDFGDELQNLLGLGNFIAGRRGFEDGWLTFEGGVMVVKIALIRTME